MVLLAMDAVQGQIKQSIQIKKCQFIFHLKSSHKYYFMEAHLSQGNK